MNEESTKQRWEWILFGALAVMLLLVVVGVALARPLIFERIVPAVLGLDDRPAAEEAPVEPPTPAPTAVPDVSDELPALVEPTIGPEEVEEETTAEPTALATIRYVVQPGDNLTRIARDHGVPVELLVELNDLPNPDRLTPGTVLLIPEE